MIVGSTLKILNFGHFFRSLIGRSLRLEGLTSNSNLSATEKSGSKFILFSGSKLYPFETLLQSAFGSFVPEVRKQILEANRAGKWHGAAPIGPIGDHVKPLKPEYLGVSEWLLGKALTTYLYFDENDKAGFQIDIDWAVPIIQYRG